ncbi:MAG: AAA family ATPase [bacterium]|nr:AAA family ATPase [bacterium]
MSTQPLAVQRAAELSAQEAEQQWLICGLWAAAGVGLIGGPPKCYKSWLGLEMALSVASKTPCLGAYATRSQGKVLLYMAEDAASVVRSRFDALARHHAVALETLDLFVITESSLRLDLVSHQRRLRETVAQIRPSMLLLDPLVRLHRIDENSASEVSALLGFLRSLQREFQTAVVLVHHARKNGSVNQPGQALRGSSDLHAFGDSNLYLRRHRQQLLLTVEHRAAPSPQPIELCLVSGHTPHLEIVESTTSGGGEELTEAVCELLRLRGPMTRTSLRQELRIRNQRLGKALTWLQDQGTIQRTASGWLAAENVNGARPAEHTEESCGADAAPNQQAFPFPPIGGQGNGTQDAGP